MPDQPTPDEQSNDIDEMKEQPDVADPNSGQSRRNVGNEGFRPERTDGTSARLRSWLTKSKADPGRFVWELRQTPSTGVSWNLD